MTPQEADPDLPVSVQESLVEAWVSGGLLQGLGALREAARPQDLLKGVAIVFITSTILGLRSSNREGTQPCPSAENWVKDLLNMSLPISPSE